jgi:type I restriction enzyme, S subunit
MENEWLDYSLTDLYSVSSGLSKPAEDFGEGYPFVSFKDVFYNFFLPDNLTQLVKSTDKERENCSVRRGDVFLTRTSETMEDLGMSCVARRDYPEATFNGFCKRLRPSTELPIHPEYVGYFLRTPQFRNEMLAFSTMSTRASLNNDMIGRLRISLPPLPEQKAIAHILGSLDDKIELNRKMNATLEGMAQALFKSWFVEFDPVIDNALAAGNSIPDERAERAEVRRQALSNGTANRKAAKHFPANFQQTESMGLIPEGWETQALYDIANFVNGASYKDIDFSDSPDALPVIKIAEVKAGITAQTKFTAVNKGDKYKVKNGDILLSWSGNPDTSIDTFIWTDGPGYLNQHIFNVCLYDDADRYFVYYQLKHLRSTFAEIARDKQTTGLGHFTAGDMKRLMVFKPQSSLLEQFNAAVSSIYSRGYENLIATRTLTKLRDTLLPKLISGELRMTEANQLVEVAQ